MPDKTAAAEEIAAIEALIGDLERRLRRLATTGRREGVNASSDFGGLVTAAADRIKNRAREQAADMSRAVAGSVSRIGSDALKKVTDEVEYRPLLMLAVAGGVGYLAGRGRLSR
jgi:tRNA A37 threonylcarbamoyltransferase TsaD